MRKLPDKVYCTEWCQSLFANIFIFLRNAMYYVRTKEFQNIAERVDDSLREHEPSSYCWTKCLEFPEKVFEPGSRSEWEYVFLYLPDCS